MWDNNVSEAVHLSYMASRQEPEGELHWSEYDDQG